ncbi:FecR family protein [Marinobacterium mangrovicola]|uniref:FecR family protein n=1 Tax=Marinobacterium mangrovicola TaxID=1476959 RepID=A0A4R1GXN5_9GAMM|nr:FecR family protein [Marinobacterium mangrovicola]TCK09202.1 FecR family protein [Marinobacterium mangrovicola]
MPIHLHTLMLTFCLFILLPAQVLADEIGRVVAVLGSALAERGEQRINLSRDDRLYEGDRLVTLEGSRLKILLRDETTLALGQNTVLELSKYQFDAQQSDVSLSFLQGAFRCNTGQIGQQKNPNFRIETRSALIGVRGTDFWGGFIFDDDLGVAMLEGKGVYVENEYGRVELTQAGEGTTVVQGRSPSSPVQWQPAKIERAIAETEVAE